MSDELGDYRRRPVSCKHPLREYLDANRPSRFRPSPFYSEAGDFLTVYFENVEGYADPLTGEITLIRDMQDNRIVGVKIYGVRKVVNDERE